MFVSDHRLTREATLNELLQVSTDNDMFILTTGKTWSEVFEQRGTLAKGHAPNFLIVGPMGHANMIALGLAKAKLDRTIWCLDGDGAATMHMGSLTIEA